MWMRKSKGVHSANAQDDQAQLRELPQLPAHSACSASPEGQSWGKRSQAEQDSQAELPGPPPRARDNHCCAQSSYYHCTHDPSLKGKSNKCRNLKLRFVASLSPQPSFPSLPTSVKRGGNTCRTNSWTHSVRSEQHIKRSTLVEI